MLACGGCGAVNPAGHRFCGTCGATLDPACGTCGAALVAGQRFCGNCGTSVSSATPTPVVAVPVPVPVAERRICSVLFCDLVGFTPLSEGRDPEEVRELLSAYFAAARTVVARYGGTIEKFIGDAVMAVWGTPTATEDDAERAVRAALDLVGAVAAVGVEAGADGLAARVGIVTGEVAVTIGATGEGMVAGDAVNTAARIQSAAGPGSVYVDDATRAAVDDAIGLVDAGAHVLKGKAEPQQLWQALVTVAGRGGERGSGGVQAPLTGRGSELRAVHDLFLAATGRRSPRLVVLTGEAGVGKSRLATEFENWIDGLAQPVWWHRGRCLSYGDGVAFWALGQIVRQRLGIAEDEGREEAGKKLAAGLDEHLPDPVDQAFVGPRLGRLIGVVADGDTGQQMTQQELFAGWRLWFERLAAQHPVVLLVEDAQHADDALLGFLDHLLDWVHDLPLFVLVLARRELAEAHPTFGSGSHRTSLSVDPLPTAAMGELVAHLLPGIPAAASAAITAAAQGIPLFAVETVRSLVDDGAVVVADGTCRIVGDLTSLAVPRSLRSLLAARVDALPAGSRRLVSEAAVLGSTFPATAISAVTTVDAADVDEALSDLVRREVLTVSADPLSPERGSYRFVQPLLRQVAYETQSRRDRKARHLAVAAHLRAAFPDDGAEVSDVVARHYLDAAAAVPGAPDNPAIRTLAVTALIAAGEHAERTGATGRAWTAYRDAADLVVEQAGPDAELTAADLRDRAGQMAQAAGRYDEAETVRTAARAAYVRAGRTRQAAVTLVKLANSDAMRGRVVTERAMLDEAYEVLRHDPDRDTVRCLYRLAFNELLSGGPDADRLSTETLLMAQQVDVDTTTMGDAVQVRTFVLAAAQRPVEASALAREGLRLAEADGDVRRLCHAWGALAVLTLNGDPLASAAASREQILLAERAGDFNALTVATWNLGAALLAAGSWDEVAALLATTFADDVARGEHVQLLRACYAALSGDVGAAREQLPDLEILVSSGREPQACLAMVRTFLAVADADPTMVLTASDLGARFSDDSFLEGEHCLWLWPAAVRAAQELGDTGVEAELLGLLEPYRPHQLNPTLRAERDRARAMQAINSGDPAGTVRLAEAVTALRGRTCSPYHLAHALLDLAGVTQPGMSRDALIDEATSIAERLGCRPLLGRAEAVR